VKTSEWQTVGKDPRVYLVSFLDKFVELGFEDTLQFVHDVGKIGQQDVLRAVLAANKKRYFINL